MQWKDAYTYEYTNHVLPSAHTRHAMTDEIAYLCKEVTEGVPLQEALADPDHVIVGGAG